MCILNFGEEKKNINRRKDVWVLAATQNVIFCLHFFLADEPLCLVFYVNLFGSGLGSLALLQGFAARCSVVVYKCVINIRLHCVRNTYAAKCHLSYSYHKFSIT